MSCSLRYRACAAAIVLAACGDQATLGTQPDDAAVIARDGGPSASSSDALDATPGAEDAAPPARDAGSVSDAGARPPLGDASFDATHAIDALPVDALVPPASTDAASADASADAASAPARDFAVGTTRVEVTARNGRKLTLQLWYPAEEAARGEASAGHPVSEFEPEGPRRVLLERLLKSAPEHCTNRTMHAAQDATPITQATPFPLLVFSHHLEGTRVALFSLAEAMARRGFVVGGPDHTPWTLYDRTDDLQSADLLATALRFDQRAATCGDDGLQIARQSATDGRRSRAGVDGGRRLRVPHGPGVTARAPRRSAPALRRLVGAHSHRAIHAVELRRSGVALGHPARLVGRLFASCCAAEAAPQRCAVGKQRDQEGETAATIPKHKQTPFKVRAAPFGALAQSKERPCVMPTG